MLLPRLVDRIERLVLGPIWNYSPAKRNRDGIVGAIKWRSSIVAPLSLAGSHPAWWILRPCPSSL
jgi:hypothetical protein